MQLKASAPAQTPPSPAPVALPPPHKKSHRGRWLLLGFVVAAGAGLYLWQRQAGRAESGAQQAAVAVVRTAPVAQGIVERTLRLTGSTGALKYVSLIAPQLRGSRGDTTRGGPSGNFSMGGGERGSRGGGRGSRGQSGDSTAGMGGGGFGGGRDSDNRNRDTSAGSSASSVASVSVSSTSSAASSGASSSRATGATRSATSRVGAGGAQRSAMVTARGTVIGDIGASAATLPGQGGQGGPGRSGGGGGGGGGGGPRGGGDFGLTLQTTAKAGTFVNKGDVVAEFDRESMLLRLDDYKASVEQSEASYRRMEAEMEVSRKAHDQTVLSARGDYDKAKLSMQTVPVASAIDAERLKLALDETDASLKQLSGEVKYVEIGIAADERIAKLELDQTKIELRRAEANIDRMQVKAPIDGLVVMQNVFRGGEFDVIKAGDQLFPGQGFMQIVDPREMIVNATVNQVDAEKLRIGFKARVRFDAFPDLELPARIYSIGTVGRPSRRPDWLKEMTVVLKLEKMDPRVIPDLSVSAEVILETAESSIAVVPREAVFYEASGNEKRPVIYVRVSAGAFERREVEVGLASNISIAVKNGVKPGEVVALEPPPAPSPGTKTG